MSVEHVTHASEDLVDAFNRLIPQLSPTAPHMTLARLEDFLSLYSTNQFVYRNDDGDIAGLATLVCFEIPTGRRGRVEDVIVDESARGQGAGLQLVEAAIELAHKRGAKTVDLTSRPSREAANRLYQRAGFERRETNVYRHSGK